MSAKDILQAVTVVAELTGTQLSDTAKAAIVEDLLAYPEPAVMTALDRCRRELTGRLTPAAILERVAALDGRPTANEAWAIALNGFDEANTIVSNDEINEGMRAARPILNAGDEVGARMAFRDAYTRIVASNRDAGIAPQWYPSLGTDAHSRAPVLEQAIERGILTAERVAGILPSPVHGDGAGIVALLENKDSPADLSPKARAKISEIRAMLGKMSAA
jgi:hypothetical protein